MHLQCKMHIWGVPEMHMKMPILGPEISGRQSLQKSAYKIHPKMHMRMRLGILPPNLPVSRYAYIQPLI